VAASSTGADAAGVKTATETRARQSSFLAAGVIFFCLLLFPLFLSLLEKCRDNLLVEGQRRCTPKVDHLERFFLRRPLIGWTRKGPDCGFRTEEMFNLKKKRQKNRTIKQNSFSGFQNKNPSKRDFWFAAQAK